MSIRSLGAIAVIVLTIVLSSFLMDRTGTFAAPTQVALPTVVEVAGDTIPVAGVPAEVVAFLEEGRSWRAARALRPLLRNTLAVTPEMKLVAARAEGGWGGWERTREILDGESWLDTLWSGEGWYWLGRAHDELGDPAAAVRAYDRFLELQADGTSRERMVAELRRGLALLRLGRREEGARSLQAAQNEAAGLDVWLELLAAEALAESGDTAATGAFVARAPEEAGIRHRARLADVRAHAVAGDLSGARATALGYRDAGGTAARRAAMSLAAGRQALAAGETAAARSDLLAALDPVSSTAAREAAGLLLQAGGLSADTRLKIAGVYERHGNAARAAENFRAWLAAGAGSAAQREEVSLRLGRVLFNAGSFADAEEVLRPLTSGSPAVAREALLLTGRSQYRRGQRNTAFTTFENLATRFPGSAEGSEGLFLVGDLSHDDGDLERAIRVYRRLADDFRGHDRAGLSLMRMAGLEYVDGDFDAAARLWNEYRSTYPRGERWLESTYWAARAYERAGDAARAAELFGAVRQREPISYYALLSVRRLGQPYWPIPLSPSPESTPAQRQRVAEWMRVVDVLRDAGLHAEADAEAERLAATETTEIGLLYALAEALNERGYARFGIRVGQRLDGVAAQTNERLLRILYPFPYRELIAAEAREKDLDPFLVAALTRQESLFTPRISSPVGARGLMQVMPETGAALARGIGIDAWDAELLFNPEINAHLGTRYLAEQMQRYDGSLPSVFSAYNAGPHRIDAWMSFPEYELDSELFTERVPYRETRDYIKILTRNLAVYTALYGQ